jgi:hypothetical protein
VLLCTDLGEREAMTGGRSFEEFYTGAVIRLLGQLFLVIESCHGRRPPSSEPTWCAIAVAGRGVEASTEKGLSLGVVDANAGSGSLACPRDAHVSSRTA